MRLLISILVPTISCLTVTSGFAQTVPGPPAASQSAHKRSAPYRTVDTIEGEWVDLVLAPVRPIERLADGRIVALNNHDSTLVEFDASGNLLQTIRLPWGPVSIATMPAGGGQPERALVVCRGTHSLAVVDMSAGQISALIPLETEPADIVMHPASGHAFVSCAGSRNVLEIDVDAQAIVASYAIPALAPSFLALDGTDVLVAPMTSGNNSIAETGSLVLNAGPRRVLDLEDPTIAVQGLPDHDLFRITPGGQAVAVARDMGAVLFAVGKNESTGEVWQLGTEANNKDALRMGEPAIQGEIVFNQVSLATLTPGSVVAPSATFNLDDTDPVTLGVQYDSARSVGQPYALDFDDAGNGYVAGLLSDNLVQLDSSGGFLREWDTGSIPRGVIVAGDGSSAWVYCWGSNTIEEWDLGPAAPTLTRTLDLGFDPTPELVAEGRRLYFSGEFSQHHNASCNSCHIEGDSDLLIWDLSNLPRDDKGPLMTQTLRGIADTRPYHWRGERDELVDFNEAFVGLLGGPELDTAPGSEFDAFEAYVLSMQQPATPGQDRRRVLSDRAQFTTPDGVAHAGNAIRGQDLFFDGNAITGFGSCATCHTMPLGTNHEIVLDEPGLENARQNHFVVAPFNALWRKEQPTMHNIELTNGVMEERPTIGSGPSVAGLKDSILDFARIDLFDHNDQEDQDITAFLLQHDSGLAPGVHLSWLLNASNTAHSAADLTNFALRQAVKRNIDLAVFGTVDLGAGARELAWYWDRELALFLPEDSTVSAQPLSFFIAQAMAGTGSNTFIGMPVGMAKSFAVDSDNDGHFDLDELASGTNPFDADSDNDGDPDGHEIAEGGDPLDDQVLANDSTAPSLSNFRLGWITTRAAKVHFDTDEPVRVDANWTAGNASGGISSDRFARVHTIQFSELKEGRVHHLELTLTDLAGLQTIVPIPSAMTALDLEFASDVIFRNPIVTVLQNSAGTLRYEISGKAAFKGGGNAAGFQLRVNRLLNGQPISGTVNGTTAGGNGITTVTVEASGLSVGDELTATVATLFVPSANTGVLWNMPRTNPNNIEFDLTYDGTGP
ncbi:MAG: hypothetical protein ACI841_001064 [Planctomycetota bacterium]|jgi:hypothetical protein